MCTAGVGELRHGGHILLGPAELEEDVSMLSESLHFVAVFSHLSKELRNVQRHRDTEPLSPLLWFSFKRHSCCSGPLGSTCVSEPTAAPPVQQCPPTPITNGTEAHLKTIREPLRPELPQEVKPSGEPRRRLSGPVAMVPTCGTRYRLPPKQEVARGVEFLYCCVGGRVGLTAGELNPASVPPPPPSPTTSTLTPPSQ